MTRLLIGWIALNVAGLWLGWHIGGNDSWSAGFGRAIRNAFYALVFGSAQLGTLRLSPAFRAPRLLSWPLVTALGFTAGVFIAKRLDITLATTSATMRGAMYGVVIGGLVVAAQWILVRPILARIGSGLGATWLASWLLAWMVVEITAATIGYHGWRIPLCATLMAATSFVAFASVHSRWSAQSAGFNTRADSASVG